MKKTITSIIAIVFALAMVMSLAACGADNSVTIPDIIDTDEATAKNLMSSNGLIPSIKNEYDDTVEAGNVIRTDPAVGTKVDKNTKVTIYISNGSSYAEAKEARVQWLNMSEGQDKWEFATPWIEEDTLYIKCDPVTFATDMKWKDDYNNGKIIGVGSINDTFSKTVPVQATYQKQEWKANESQGFTLEIPLKDLDVSRPTDMYLRLYTIDPKNEDISIDVNVSFYMTW